MKQCVSKQTEKKGKNRFSICNSEITAKNLISVFNLVVRCNFSQREKQIGHFVINETINTLINLEFHRIVFDMK